MYSEGYRLDRRDKYKSNSRKILYIYTMKSVAFKKETNTRGTVERFYLCTVKGIALIEETITRVIVE